MIKAYVILQLNTLSISLDSYDNEFYHLGIYVFIYNVPQFPQ